MDRGAPMNVRHRWTNVFSAVVRGWRRLWHNIPDPDRLSLSRGSGRVTSGGALSLGVMFRLHSPARQDHPTLPEEIRTLRLRQRARFTSGALFYELSQKVPATAVWTAYIIEETHDRFHHLLAIYPGDFGLVQQTTSRRSD
jgi:hypothetical protein